MSTEFSGVFLSLRKERGLSQRQVAADLGISQALLSHYENGLREPKLKFVVKACDYYGVSADYMLGRTGPEDRNSAASILGRIRDEIARLQSIETDLAKVSRRVSGTKKAPVKGE